MLPEMVFLLSAPRSGSTLLRAMLGGHPELFSPPELNLLPFSSMGEREAMLASSAYRGMPIAADGCSTSDRGQIDTELLVHRLSSAINLARSKGLLHSSGPASLRRH